MDLHVMQTAAGVVAEGPPTQSPSPTGVGIASGGLLAVVVLGFLLHRLLDKKKAKFGHLAMAFTMGTLLAGSVVGLMAQQIASSLSTAGTAMLTTVTTTNGGGTTPSSEPTNK